MHFTALFAAASIAISGATATPLSTTIDISSLFGTDLSASNHYGAPIAPWHSGANPGWYFGDHGQLFPDLLCLEGLLCKILDLLPFDWLHCPVKPPPTPPPSDGYTQTFANLTGATQADGYQTFGLVDTIAQCKAMCDAVQGCKFVNTYHDVNGKGGSTQLTCALFDTCYDASTATNTGGQSQPDGSINFITNSDGYCKQ
ncbi:putative fruit-body specific protein a [Lyophyllum shimeji]|uniref:Fruit-body specific protein a n=1 Tax=Lyophyllum shimeji TaxID=47721 RepID=A0A9P3PZU8_LYOSH|nr:putative fruit-body specific protein a [Lyophyllum shimeji]